jgi:hypothetical protein
MTRGAAWDAQELQIVCRAYKMATENSINGADQTVLSFGDSLVRHLRNLQPDDLQDNDLRYANRVNARDSILRNLKKKAFLDIQKFQRRLLSIQNKRPTGNLDDIDLHCMAIANHLNWCQGLNYDYITTGIKSFNPATEWLYYLAYLEVRHLPKFDISPHRTIVEAQNVRVNNRSNGTAPAPAPAPARTAVGIVDDSDADDIIVSNGNVDLPTQPVVSNTFIDTADVAAGRTTPRGSRGIKKAKFELKQNHQVEEGLKTVKEVGNDISKITDNVEIIRHAMEKKHQRKYKAEVIALLQQKHDALIHTNPVEAEMIFNKINKKRDEQIEELDDDEDE